MEVRIRVYDSPEGAGKVEVESSLNRFMYYTFPNHQEAMAFAKGYKRALFDSGYLNRFDLVGIVDQAKKVERGE